MTTDTTTAPPVIRAAWVRLPPADAFEVFTDEIGAWWPLPTHGIFGNRAGGLTFRDGRLIERSIDGTETTWGHVLIWEPAERLVITWHPGRDDDDASRVEVSFEPDAGGTRVVLEHRGWETFGEQALDRRRSYAGPGAWGSVLDHYGDATESRCDGPDLRDLGAAYEAFLIEAEAGGFGDAAEGEWDADRVIAHVTLNDAAILAVCQSLVHGSPITFENRTCQDPAVLTAWVDACGTRDELIVRCRHMATQTMAALRRLTPEQRATEVHCRLAHDGTIVLDGPRPWDAIAVDAQSTMHLPAHVDQLRNLRA